MKQAQRRRNYTPLKTLNGYGVIEVNQFGEQVREVVRGGLTMTQARLISSKLAEVYEQAKRDEGLVPKQNPRAPRLADVQSKEN